jgi:hypothetical protein
MPAEDGLGDLEAELLADSRFQSACVVCDWITEHGEEWDRHFADGRITAAALWRAMKKRDFAFTDAPVKTHRQKRHRVA